MGSTLVLDESMAENVITVAGVIVPSDRLTDVSDAWRSLKADTFNIDPSLELKYNIPDDHPCRKPLDHGDWTQARRVPAMLDCI